MSAKYQSAMQRAIDISAQSLGVSSPNPPVGAVLINDAGVVIAEGTTQPAGQPHAEAVALKEAGERARGATMVCTLEPCAHTGRTGPCTSALIAAGVARVVYAVSEQNRAAAGGGQLLLAAGIEVLGDYHAPQAAAGPLRYWLHAQRTGRPYVSWKMAASLDGQSAAADGTSQWITSDEARTEVHQLRSRIDAILVGAGTVRTDNPQLTARTSGGQLRARQPLRVVISNSARLPATATVFDDSAPTLLAIGAGVSHEQAQSFPCPVLQSTGPVSEGVDLAALLGELYQRGVVHALLEGGPTLAGSFISANLVDEVIAYVAPKLLLSGMWPALRGYGVESIADAINLDFDDVSRVGPDLRITARLISSITRTSTQD